MASRKPSSDLGSPFSRVRVPQLAPPSFDSTTRAFTSCAQPGTNSWQRAEAKGLSEVGLSEVNLATLDEILELGSYDDLVDKFTATGPADNG